MEDLISRKEALKALREIYVRGNGLRPATVDMINAIKFLPSAEKRGKWKPIDVYEVVVACSECKQKFTYEHNFCPNCGAKMEVTE